MICIEIKSVIVDLLPTKFTGISFSLEKVCRKKDNEGGAAFVRLSFPVFDLSHRQISWLIITFYFRTCETQLEMDSPIVFIAVGIKQMTCRSDNSETFPPPNAFFFLPRNYDESFQLNTFFLSILMQMILFETREEDLQSLTVLTWVSFASLSTGKIPSLIRVGINMHNTMHVTHSAFVLIPIGNLNSANSFREIS